MRSMKKALLLMLCAALLVSATVFGTLAYLTDSDQVTNTFTVGKVYIDLDEADVKPDGTLDTNERVKENEYHLLPGHTYIKDPTVTVKAGSSDAYVRMIVTVNNYDVLEAALNGLNGYFIDLNGDQNTDVVLEKLLDDSWNYGDWHFEKFTESGTTATYEFRYKEIVAQSAADTKLSALFTKIKVPGELDNTHLAYLDAVEIVVTAHAIQADGFENDENGAWLAFDGQVNAGG